MDPAGRWRHGRGCGARQGRQQARSRPGARSGRHRAARGVSALAGVDATPGGRRQGRGPGAGAALAVDATAGHRRIAGGAGAVQAEPGRCRPCAGRPRGTARTGPDVQRQHLPAQRPQAGCRRQLHLHAAPHVARLRGRRAQERGAHGDGPAPGRGRPPATEPARAGPGAADRGTEPQVLLRPRTRRRPTLGRVPGAYRAPVQPVGGCAAAQPTCCGPDRAVR